MPEAQRSVSFAVCASTAIWHAVHCTVVMLFLTSLSTTRAPEKKIAGMLANTATCIGSGSERWEYDTQTHAIASCNLRQVQGLVRGVTHTRSLPLATAQLKSPGSGPAFPSTMLVLRHLQPAHIAT